MNTIPYTMKLVRAPMEYLPTLRSPNTHSKGVDVFVESV